MKTKNLCLLAIILFLFACKQHPDSRSAFRIMDTIDSGRVFVHTALTIQKELQHYQELLDDPNVSAEIKEFLNEQKKTTLKADSLMKVTGYDLMAMAAKKPPRPCPGDTSSCLYKMEFFGLYTTQAENKLKIFVNDTELALEEVGYDEQTQILTLRVPGKLIYDEGDMIRLEMPLSLNNAQDNIKSTTVEREFYGTR